MRVLRETDSLLIFTEGSFLFLIIFSVFYYAVYYFFYRNDQFASYRTGIQGWVIAIVLFAPAVYVLRTFSSIAFDKKNNYMQIYRTSFFISRPPDKIKYDLHKIIKVWYKTNSDNTVNLEVLFTDGMSIPLLRKAVADTDSSVRRAGERLARFLNVEYNQNRIA